MRVYVDFIMLAAYLKNGPVLYLGLKLTVHVIRSPSRETAPLSSKKTLVIISYWICISMMILYNEDKGGSGEQPDPVPPQELVDAPGRRPHRARIHRVRPMHEYIVIISLVTAKNVSYI
jgi:hypothetical protein